MPRELYNNARLYRILEALRDVGDMTGYELMDLLDMGPDLFYRLMNRYRKNAYIRVSDKVPSGRQGPKFVKVYSITQTGLDRLEYLEKMRGVWEWRD